MSEEATVTEMPRRSLREQILNHRAPKGEIHDVPEWDAKVELRSMTIAQKGNLIGDEDPSPAKLMLMLPEVLVFTCHDPESGEALFTPEDLDWLKAQPASVVERLATEGLRVSGMEEAAAQAEKKDS